jgi:ribonuclease BN (tRNA processing enzyme)
MKLIFLGTRGGIKRRSRRHWRHSALLIEQGATRVMIDCGADWKGKIERIAPAAIMLTHAHPDHAAGLTKGPPCSVYAAAETIDLLRRYPVEDWRKMPVERAVKIGGLKFEAIPVQHSLRAPAVGYRVSAEGRCFFYVPDIAAFADALEALRGVNLYIGDGATILRSMIRKRNGLLIGHAPITTQLRWCQEAGIRHAIFTHCGSGIVGGQTHQLNDMVERLGREHGITAWIAEDKDRLSFRADPVASSRFGEKI